MFTAYQLVSTSITLVIIKEKKQLNIYFKLIIRLYIRSYIYVMCLYIMTTLIYTLKNVLLPQHTKINKPEPTTTEANYLVIHGNGI